MDNHLLENIFHKMTPYQYCKNIIKESHSSFHNAFIFIQGDKKKALIGLYAFCRKVDDAVDEISDYEVGKAKINWWKDEVDHLFNNQPSHPITRHLLKYIKQFNLNKSYFLEILDGMEMDLNFNRYESFKELQLYCYRVASAVGILATSIFDSKPTTKIHNFSHNLGIALQLTNIIRDIGEDARCNRIYIPLSELKKFSINENDIVGLKENIEIKPLIENQIRQAENFYHKAFADTNKDTFKKHTASIIMGNIYYELLQEIKKSNLNNVLNEKIALTSFRKFIITINTILFKKIYFNQ